MPDGRQIRSSPTLTEQSPQASLVLGLFAVPAEFDFEAGALYRRGCRPRLEIGQRAGQEPLEILDFHQTMQSADQSEVLELGTPDRVPHFGWQIGGSRSMDPPVLLWLDTPILANPDDVLVHYQLRTAERRIDSEQSLTRIPAVLRVTPAGADQPVHEESVEILPDRGQKRLDVAGWSDGRYGIEIVPQVDGSEDRDGPAVVYRRNRLPASAVRLSPLAPCDGAG